MSTQSLLFWLAFLLAVWVGCPAIGLAQTIKWTDGATSLVANVSSVMEKRLDDASNDGSNFLLSNANYAQTRSYPNAQINTRNVGGLRVAWLFQTDIEESME